MEWTEDDRRRVYRLGVQELFRRASEASKANRLEDAEEMYRLWLYYEPENPYPQYGLACVLLAMGKYEEGFQLYESRLGIPQLRILEAIGVSRT